MLAEAVEKGRLLQMRSTTPNKRSSFFFELKTREDMYKTKCYSKQKQIKKPYVFDG